MKIIVDAFGGDNAPLEIIKGSALAEQELGCEIILCGDEAKIKACAQENQIDISRMQIKHTQDVILVEDDPGSILKAHKNSSMGVGLQALAEGEGDAFVSAGSTGAVVMGSTFLVKRIKGVKRAALAPIMPTDNGQMMLIDSGANAVCTAEMLNAFAIMASIFMEKVQGIKNPRVALANIGTEENKGTPMHVEAHELMKKGNYNFIGNIEARDVPAGLTDIVVCDGFTGNIILKMYEGVAGVLMGNIKKILYKNLITKLAALVIKGGLTDLKKRMDYTEFGGAPLMGIAKPVIKAHGSSNAKAFKNAIKQAMYYAQSGAIAEIEKNIASMKKDSTNTGEEEEG